jgi:hypothetical protein
VNRPAKQVPGNYADFNGGGIYIHDPTGPVTLTNVTLTGNEAGGGRGGGLYVFSGSLVLHNTLLAGNFRGYSETTRDDVFGALTSGGDYNLIGDGTGMTGLINGVNGNQVGSPAHPIDPLLGPLDDNGGPTRTHALLPGSPALDAGNNAYASDWDQRGPGFRRIVNGTIDIGAFEVQAHAHGRPIGQALPAPIPVQALALPGGPPLGPAPELIAGPLPVPGPALPDAPAGRPEPVSAAGPAPEAAAADRPVASVGLAPPPPLGPVPAGADLAAFDPWPGADLKLS